jgi:hypothetical protein
MNKLLLKYIRSYLAEATIPYSANEINAELQHELSPNIPKDMTSLNNEETIKVLMQNIDEKTCISFVNKYDESIPSFNINPHARYNTPHGNYAYPLTLKNFRTLSRSKKVSGTNFAIDRPYFLLFKINSPNTLVIDKEGKTNYKELKSNKRAMSRGDNISAKQDIESVVRSFLYFVSSYYLDKDSFTDYNDTPFDQPALTRLFRTFRGVVSGNFEEAGWSEKSTQEFIKDFSTALSTFFERFKSTLNNKITNKVHQNIMKLSEEFIVRRIETISKKPFNKYRDLGDFHKLYFTCWILSLVAQETTSANSNGPIFTMFLKEAGIDGVVDFGSSTLHDAEPEQTVLLNFGNIEGKDIDFIGTFDNVFRDLDSDDFEELASQIYETEGFKFSTDIFSPQSQEEKDAFSNEMWLDSSYLHETIENKAHDLGADMEIKEVEFEGNFITISMSHFISTQTDVKSLLIYDMIKHLLNQHYKGKSVVIYLDFDSLTQGNLTPIIEKIMLNSSFKAFLMLESIRNVEISIIASNSYINISEKVITLLGNVSGKLGLISPFINIINNSGSQNFKIYVKDLLSLKHFDKVIQSGSENVIIDVSEPDLEGNKFLEKDIKEFVSKNSSDNMFSAIVKTK